MYERECVRVCQRDRETHIWSRPRCLLPTDPPHGSHRDSDSDRDRDRDRDRDTETQRQRDRDREREREGPR